MNFVFRVHGAALLRMQQTCGEKRLEVGAHVTPNAFDKEVQDSARHDAPRSGLISSEFWSTGMPRSSASPFAFATVSSRQPPKEADLKSDWAIVVLVLLGLSFFTCTSLSNVWILDPHHHEDRAPVLVLNSLSQLELRDH